MVQPPLHFRASLTLTLAFLFSVCSLSYQQLLVFGLTDVTGNFVLSQSLGLGSFLLGMGLGTWNLHAESSHGLRRLIMTEWSLSLLGLLSLFVLYGGEVTLRYFFPALQAERMLFVFLPFILAIGFFTGREVPLLIGLSPQVSQAKIFGWTYFGALLALMGIPLFLLPLLDLPKSVFLIGLVNFCLAYLLIAIHGFSLKWHAAAVAFALLLMPWLQFEREWRDFHLKFIYFPVSYSSYDNIEKDFARFKEVDPPLRLRSSYQWIDLIPRGSSQLMGEENDFSLYLDRKFQFSAQTQQRYHESMVTGGIHLLSRVPRRVLVLGGGDGLLLPHLLKHSGMEQVTLVELDREILDLARRNKEMSRLNQSTLGDARVRIHTGDAFHYIRGSKENFDLILIDFPLPTTYELSQLYTREFYTFVHRLLHDDGIMVMDFALPDQKLEGLSILVHTLAAAGFPRPLAYGQEDLFLAMSPSGHELRFDFEELEKSASNQTLLSFSSQQEFLERARLKAARVNSIFFPQRFNFEYTELL